LNGICAHFFFLEGKGCGKKSGKKIFFATTPLMIVREADELDEVQFG
jgi:hypothetical protein